MYAVRTVLFRLPHWGSACLYACLPHASLPARPPCATLLSYLPAGLRGEELAAAREVKYQLNSGLRGLGTANLGQICGGYQVCDDLTLKHPLAARLCSAGSTIGPGPGLLPQLPVITPWMLPLLLRRTS